MEKKLVIENKLDQLSLVAAFTEELCEELGQGADVSFNLNLVLEEALANVISYAFPGTDSAHDIEITAKEENGSLILSVCDDGIAFDPTRMPDPDVTLSAEERSVGGLGIFLIRNIMDDVKYQRYCGHNILTMTKKI